MENVIVPQIGEAVSELMIAEWFKSVGDTVEKGEPLFSVDSDKAVVEVEAVVAGTLTEIVANEGASVMPGDVVGKVATAATEPGVASKPGVASEAAGPEKATEPPAAPRQTGSVGDPVGPRPVAGHATGAPKSGNLVSGFVPASPRARKRAKDSGVDLRSIPGAGSGPRGMFVEADLEGPGRDPASLRDRIAQRTLESKRNVPHFYLSTAVDMLRLMALRGSKGIGVTAAVVKAAGMALEAVPEANVLYDDGLQPGAGSGVGLVVAVEGGLRIPVVPDVAAGGIEVVHAAVGEAAAQARSGRLSSRFQGAKTVTVSNLGMHDVDFFLPIIDTPGSMILGVGATRDRVVAVDGAVAVRPVCLLALAADHRAMDGIAAGRYLGAVKSLLEDPAKLGMG